VRIGFAAHAEVDVFAGAACGHGVDLRIEEIRPTFEDAHAPSLACMQSRQRRDHGGLALAGGWGGN
jgi:hypothetical protein